MTTFGSTGRLATLALAATATLLASCSPAPAPPPAATPATSTGAGAKPAIPEDMRVVPDVPADYYKRLMGEGETPLAGGRIVRHLESDLNSLNPVLQTQTYEAYTNRYLFDPLFDYNQKLDIVGVLAESFQIAADRKSVEISVRKDVKFHDGVALTARDVCFTFDVILDPAVPAINTRSSLFQLERCTVLDEHRVRLDWKVVYAPWKSALAGINIVPAHIYKVKDSADFAKQEANRKPVGSGPWKFESWEAQSKVVLKRNDDYWGPKPMPDETVLKVIDNRETALKACLSGELDEQYVPSSKWFSEVANPEYDDFNKVLYYTYSFNYYGLNNKHPLFSDKRVRQAMAMAHDGEGVVKELYSGLARTISGPMLTTSEWYDQSVNPWPFDLAAATKKLEEAGWKDSNGDGTIDRDGQEFAFELLYPAGNTISEQTGAVYQQDLGKIGIKMTLRALEGATFFDRVNKGDFVACTLAWSMDPDPEGVMAIFDSRQAPPVGVNSCFYSNPEVDRLIDAERLEFDHAKRVEIVHQIHRILAEDVPMVFALQTPYKRIFRKNIRGIAMSNYDPYLIVEDAAHWWLVGGKGSGPAR